ncbi:hypothetical protein LINPERPRIM_LOCUS22284 [Linum perenne]
MYRYSKYVKGSKLQILDNILNTIHKPGVLTVKTMHSGIVSNNFRVPFQLPKHRLVIHCSGTLSETPVIRYLSRKFLQNWWVARGQSFIIKYSDKL